MSERTYTRGPWHWEGEVLCNDEIIVGGDSWMFNEANKKLIAAAPKLLEALQNYMAAVNQMNAAMNDGVNVQGAMSNLVGSEDMARAAIAKALGNH